MACGHQRTDDHLSGWHELGGVEALRQAFAIFLGILLGVLAIFPLETPTITLPIRVFMLINPFLIYPGVPDRAGSQSVQGVTWRRCG